MPSFGRVSLIINHYPARFCGHRPCRRGDILYFIGHVTLSAQVTVEVLSKWQITLKNNRFALDYLYNDWQSMTAFLTVYFTKKLPFFYVSHLIYINISTSVYLYQHINISLINNSYLYQHFIDFRINMMEHKHENVKIRNVYSKM